MIPIFDLEQSLKLDEHIELANITKNDIAKDSALEIAKYLLDKTTGKIMLLIGASYKGVIGILLADLLQKNDREVVLLPMIWDKRHIVNGLVDTTSLSIYNSVVSVDKFLEYSVIIDAIFDIEDNLMTVTDNIFPLIDEVNEARNVARSTGNDDFHVMSIDVPSGINTNTGQIIHKSAICADATLTLQTLKQGLVLEEGIWHSGNIAILDIGLGEFLDLLESNVYLNEPDLWKKEMAIPKNNSNKYSRGHVVILGGQMAGAAQMAAQSARRAGAGVVTIAYLEKYEMFYTNTPEGILVRKLSGSDDKKLSQWLKLTSSQTVTAIVIGCGLFANSFTRWLVATSFEAIDKNGAKLILDGGVLTSFSKNNTFQSLSTYIKHSKSDVILTPNFGEFYKMFSPFMDLNQSNVALVEEASILSGAHILLKGSVTCIANPYDSKIILNNHSSYWMSTAGTGNILDGILATLVSQMPSTVNAVAASVWIHGNAGIESGTYMLAEDMLFYLQNTMEKLLVK